MEIFEKTIEYWQAGGILLIPIAIVCFGVWIYFLKSRDELLRTLRDSEGIDEELAERLGGGDRGAASKFYASRPGMLAQALANALTGGKDPGDSFARATGQSLSFLRRDLVVLAGLTAAAPLLGLLGTVRGMIDTFTGVAAAGDTADYVAAGISQALITTQVGLVVAIPGVFGIARLRRLLGSVKTRVDSCRAHLSYALSRSEGK